MRAAILIPAAFGVLALAACDKAGTDQAGPAGAQASTAAAPAPAADLPQPGRYRTTIRIVDVAIPGMAPEMAARMKGMFGASGQSREFCLAADQAAKGYRDVTRSAAQGTCSYDSFSARGGVIDAALTCQTGKGMTARTLFHGTYAPGRSTLTMTTDSEAARLPGGRMRIVAEVTNQRTGDC